MRQYAVYVVKPQCTMTIYGWRIIKKALDSITDRSEYTVTEGYMIKTKDNVEVKVYVDKGEKE